MAQTFPNPSYPAGVDFKPYALLPDSKKNWDWYVNNVNWCISMAMRQWQNNSELYSQYNLANGVRNDEDYENITKLYGIETPAGKLKHIPLIRPMVHRKLSEVEERPLEHQAFLVDSESVKEKIQDISSKLLNDIFQVLSSGKDIEKALESMERYYKEEIKSELEINLNNYLYNYILKHRADRMFSEAAHDSWITGMAYAKVSVEREGEDPQLEVIKPMDIAYSKQVNARWVGECEWVVRKKVMTVSSIIDTYGQKLTKAEKDELTSDINNYDGYAPYKADSMSGVENVINSLDGEGGYDPLSQRIVYEVEFVSIKKVDYVEVENKYDPSAPFSKLLSEGEAVAGTKRKKKSRYIQVLHKGVRIGDRIYVDFDTVSSALRNPSNPSRVYNSFHGLTFNGNVKPLSVYKDTKSLQDLYDISHFHIENMVALSGTKGSFIDKSLIPTLIEGDNPIENFKRWIYYKKMGLGVLDSSLPGAKRDFVPQNFDDTLGNSVDVLRNFINHIEETASRIIGVARQQLGDLNYSDGKSTTQQAISQSSMVTEFKMNQHDEFIERVLTAVANLAKHAFPEGARGMFVDRNGKSRIYSFVEGDGFDYASVNIHITNKISDKKAIEELKAIGVNMIREKVMEVEDILPIFKQATLSEVIRQIETSVSKRRAEVMAAEQGIQQAEMKLEQERNVAEVEKLKAEVQSLLGTVEMNKAKLALQEKELSDIRELENKKLKLEQRRVEAEESQLSIVASDSVNKRTMEVKNKK